VHASSVGHASNNLRLSRHIGLKVAPTILRHVRNTYGQMTSGTLCQTRSSIYSPRPVRRPGSSISWGVSKSDDVFLYGRYHTLRRNFSLLVYLTLRLWGDVSRGHLFEYSWLSLRRRRDVNRQLRTRTSCVSPRIAWSQPPVDKVGGSQGRLPRRLEDAPNNDNRLDFSRSDSLYWFRPWSVISLPFFSYHWN